MNLYDTIDGFMASMANFLWGTPLVILLLGGGFYFSIVSRLVPLLILDMRLISFLENMIQRMIQDR